MSLRLCIDSIKGRDVSQSNVSHFAGPSTQTSQSASSLCDPLAPEKIVRKKSGQLVKPSLKTSRSNSLSVYTLPLSSKSEPTTPTSKAVHFDSKLEHVKLFLAEQKPLAVSRDGSPTDDTSGTESDFPGFIFGGNSDGASEDRRPKKKLLMQVVNMPMRVNLNSDVALEEMVLSAEATSILGKVRVRNIAYAKSVAVRFTFDSWQTTSEVTGKYVASLSSEFDGFSFSIRLNDLLATIEGKTLIVAIKYMVEGKEIWDNNFGHNYLATFKKTKMSKEDQPSSPTKKVMLLSSEDEADMADLKNKLEKVVQGKDRPASGPTFRRPAQSPASADPDITSFRSSASFASRYDFSASFKSSWNPDKTFSSTSSMHTRTRSFPLSSTKSGNGSPVPWPQKRPSDLYALRRASPPVSIPVASPTQGKAAPPGSPRDLGEDVYSPLRSPLELEDPPFPVLQPQQASTQSRSARNQSRRGYFDLSVPSGTGSLRRTPPGTPRSPGEDQSRNRRSASTSPVRVLREEVESVRVDMNVEEGSGGDSALSTPSMSTPSSSRESSPSPTELFMSMVDEENALSPETHYRQFLNKFCFFTGPGSTITSDASYTYPDETIPRTRSASEIEELLSGISPRLQAIANGTAGTAIGASPLLSPSRSPSLDDLMLGSKIQSSGSLTPTVSRLSFARLASQQGTPVLA
ncbi:putative phosphatase regulatory subunit-domain-containing protein [Gymnopilus junonius]|uniref:Phosphatase regulatory subunit-domain-containing protein n=1 Tax=Gymnopilus junonius TaxID=109634 RepID=A0A9P5TLL0_GYMJU|nr:putative phosphatase regulatory subunit-domain-containing protein [Gymnopilus junonius]